MTMTAMGNRRIEHPAPIVRLYFKLTAMIKKWRTNRCTRKELERLSEFMLEDLGISRHQAEQEYTKPFWKN